MTPFVVMAMSPLRKSSMDASMVSASAMSSRDARPTTAFVHEKTYELEAVGSQPKEVIWFPVMAKTSTS